MKNASATRHYRVGGIPFMIELESPWIPMEYTEPVKGGLRMRRPREYSLLTRSVGME